jgi:hypothetical protein
MAVAFLAIAAGIHGCAKTPTRFIDRNKPGDATLNCEQIAILMGQRAAEAKQIEDSKSKDAVGILFLAPIITIPFLLAANASKNNWAEQQVTEFGERNIILASFAGRLQCEEMQVLTALDVFNDVNEDWAGNNALVKAANADSGPDFGEDQQTGTQFAIHGDTKHGPKTSHNMMPAQPGAPAKYGRTPSDEASSQDLMQIFLRGDISPDEYKKLRAKF